MNSPTTALVFNDQKTCTAIFDLLDQDKRVVLSYDTVDTEEGDHDGEDVQLYGDDDIVVIGEKMTFIANVISSCSKVEITEDYAREFAKTLMTE